MSEQQAFPFFQPVGGAPTRREDPDTSHEAGDQFTGERLRQIQQDVWDYFLRVKKATDEDLKDALSDKYPIESTWRTRRSELVRMGYLMDSGGRKLNRNGRLMIIWKLARD